jgi:mRNA-degrading endonuclease RelE of RelBE toxin-antitoxin system
MTRTLSLLPAVEKQLRRLPRRQQERLMHSMRSLGTEPRPHGREHLQGPLYRVRVGECRIVYAVFENDVVVVVCRAAHRAEKTYLHLEKMLDRALQEMVS